MLTAHFQQIRDELGELRTALQELSGKLGALLQTSASGERDPGDAVPPGVAVHSPAPLTAEEQEGRQKLEHELRNPIR